ncbi:MAG: hypothetical protein AAGG75_27170 [Bacteroidota bacterium]
MSTLFAPRAIEKEFLPQEFRITVWSRLKPYYNELLNRRIKEIRSFDRWWTDFKEMRAAIREEYNIRLLRAWQQPTDERIFEAFSYLALEVMPRAQQFEHLILSRSLEFAPAIRKSIGGSLSLIQEQVARFGKKNALLEQEIIVQIQGFLCRNSAKKISEDKAQDFLRQLCERRQHLARQTGYTDYASYHSARLSSPIPVSKAQLYRWTERILSAGEALRSNDAPMPNLSLRSRGVTEQLLAKVPKCLNSIDPALGRHFQLIQEARRLHVKARGSKSSLARLSPMPLSGIPHLTLHATQPAKALPQLFHLIGWGLYAAFHPEQSMLEGPSAAAEFSGQSLRLISSEHWDNFFIDKEQWQTAQKIQLRQILDQLQLAMVRDRFEQSLYTNPAQDLKALWTTTYGEWNAPHHLPELLKIGECPFSGIRQLYAGLSALYCWQQYQEAPKMAFSHFLQGLSAPSVPASNTSKSLIFSKWAPNDNTIKKVATFVTDFEAA